MISILIITYGRVDELIDTLKCINNYSGDKIELLLLDNNTESHLRDSIYKSINNDSIVLSYYHTGENLGVARGRNYLITRARGDILITLDDDLYIEDINYTIKTVQQYFNENSSLGVLAFKIINFYSKTQLRHEQPHGNKRKVNFNSNFYTYYFIGAGHAIRKEVYNNAGLYPLDLGLYGGEERDLSFRILEAEYDILYVANIIVYHKVSPNGRMNRKDENYFRYRNQLIVLNRYMPFIYRITSTLIWSFFFLFIKKGSFIDVCKVVREISFIEKKTISRKVLDKLKKINARIIF